MVRTPLVTIGAFSVMTQLSRKTLHHYHDVDLLVPLEVDPHSGYRRYGVDQVADARLIRQLRALEMPIPEVRHVVRADPDARERAIAAHLDRMEARLDETRRHVRALRSLLVPDQPPWDVTVQVVPALRVAGIAEPTTLTGIDTWWDLAMDEVRAAFRSSGERPAGPPGGLYDVALFRDGAGQATVYIPATGEVEPTGRVRNLEIPSARLAELTHSGPDESIGEAYAALGIAVGRRGTGIDGPIRETYLGHPADGGAPPRRTVIGWPVSEDHRD